MSRAAALEPPEPDSFHRKFFHGFLNRGRRGDISGYP